MLIRRTAPYNLFFILLFKYSYAQVVYKRLCRKRGFTPQCRNLDQHYCDSDLAKYKKLNQQPNQLIVSFRHDPMICQCYTPPFKKDKQITTNDQVLNQVLAGNLNISPKPKPNQKLILMQLITVFAKKSLPFLQQPQIPPPVNPLQDGLPFRPERGQRRTQ